MISESVHRCEERHPGQRVRGRLGGEVGITAVSRGGLGGLSMAGTWREVTL